MKLNILFVVGCAIGSTWASAPCQAGAKSKLAQEAAQYLAGKFGREAAEEGLETMARKIEHLALKHGDDVFVAVRKAGPQTLRVVEQAGEHGGQVVKLLARHGDDAVWVVSRPGRLAIFVKYGDNAAEAMMKHKGVAEPLLAGFGQPAARALKSVNTQNGRRLAMMLDEGELVRIGRTTELLEVIGRHGDRAMEIVWKHRYRLMVAAALGAFLADPEPFLDGKRELPQ